jgi:hypothetical protein
MKTIIATAKMLLAAGLIVATQGLFAQTDTLKKDDNKYRLHIVRDENGKKEVIDMAFATKAGMDDYIKQNKLDLPGEMALPSPDEKSKKNNKDKKEKKIIIIEKDESGLNKDIDLEIGAAALTEEERLELIQQLLNIKGCKVRVIQITKTEPSKKTESTNNDNEANRPPSVIDQPVTCNLTDVKVFPNPSTGQFHVCFTVNKPSAIKLRISDLQGNEVYAYAVNNYSGIFDKDIIRPGLSNGTYLLDIEAGGEKETTKVVMQ